MHSMIRAWYIMDSLWDQCREHPARNQGTAVEPLPRASQAPIDCGAIVEQPSSKETASSEGGSAFRLPKGKVPTSKSTKSSSKGGVNKSAKFFNSSDDDSDHGQGADGTGGKGGKVLKRGDDGYVSPHSIENPGDNRYWILKQKMVKGKAVADAIRAKEREGEAKAGPSKPRPKPKPRAPKKLSDINNSDSYLDN
ncbi:hypothetical protein C8R47DRAFT_1064135 [Mycena vitilis]|nr:hypothetical protein C8R47DRAFT_1064135 [Mycena vitilis]